MSTFDPAAWIKAHKGLAIAVGGGAAAGGVVLYKKEHSSSSSGATGSTVDPANPGSGTGDDAAMLDNLGTSVGDLLRADSAQNAALKRLSARDAALTKRDNRLLKRLKALRHRKAKPKPKATHETGKALQNAVGSGSVVAARSLTQPASAPTGTLNRPTPIMAPRTATTRAQGPVSHPPVFHRTQPVKKR